MRMCLTIVLLMAGCTGSTTSSPTVATGPTASPATTTPTPSPPTTPTPPPTPSAAASSVPASRQWQLLAIPDHLRMAERAAFRLRRQVTNTAGVPVDATMAVASFSVDGAPSMSLNLAFGNGAREARWQALPPGDTIFDERAMGTTLFVAPGTYVITMEVDGTISTATVRVDP